jgi:hypothetical protein
MQAQAKKQGDVRQIELRGTARPLQERALTERPASEQIVFSGFMTLIGARREGARDQETRRRVRLSLRKRPSYFKSFNSTTVPKSLPEASVARASMALNPSFSSGHFASSALASAWFSANAFAESETSAASYFRTK